MSTKNRILDDYEDEPIRGRMSLKNKRITRHDDAEDTSESSTNPDDDTQVYEDLFAAVMAATDPADSSRQLHAPFLLKPSKKVSQCTAFPNILLLEILRLSKLEICLQS